jgi:hypothetical protein
VPVIQATDSLPSAFFCVFLSLPPLILQLFLIYFYYIIAASFLLICAQAAVLFNSEHYIILFEPAFCAQHSIPLINAAPCHLYVWQALCIYSFISFPRIHNQLLQSCKN